VYSYIVDHRRHQPSSSPPPSVHLLYFYIRLLHLFTIASRLNGIFVITYRTVLTRVIDAIYNRLYISQTSTSRLDRFNCS